MPFRTTTRVILSCAILVGILAPSAHAAPPKNEPFFDVPAEHYAYDAVEYLRNTGILGGYSDGTFRPDKNVNRAEALKIVATQLLSDDEAKKYVTSPFIDVPDDAWFLPYVEWGRGRGVIQGPPAAARFDGSRPVTKAELLKMFLTSRRVDPNAFGDIALPLSRDATDTQAWYYSSLRYAVASTMTVATSQHLYSPAKQLTRGEVALLLHRYFQYRDGQRAADALVEARKEVENEINFLSAGNFADAQYASARGLLVARGANEIRPNDTVVKVAVKVAEGARALVRAYDAAQKQQWDTVIKLSQDAWFLGDQAKKISSSATTVANQLQTYAKSFADQARKYQ